MMMGARYCRRRWSRAALIGLVAVLSAWVLGAAPAAAMPGAQPSTFVPPTASFSHSSPDVVGSPITFDGSASTDNNGLGGSIVSYLWDFGDGSTATTTTPTTTHTYTTAQTYQVTLTVTDSEGGTSAPTSQTITIADETPTAAIIFSPSNPGVGSTVQFDGTTSNDPDGSITTYSWDFGDGSTGTGATPTHANSTAGAKTVTHTITDSDGQTNSTTNTVMVGPAQPPTAAFPAPGGSEGVAVSFDGSASSEPNPGGTITSYAWDFGDGTAATTSGPTTSHAYAQPGSYTATLTVTDSYGQTSSAATQTVIVSDAAAVAAIGVFPTTPSVGTVIAFTGTRTGDPDDATATYSWRFGDGTQASGASVTHVYEEAGTYTVVLTVTDSDGQASAKQRVTVAPLAYRASAPSAVFAAPSGGAGSPVAFDAGRSSDPNPGGTLSYRWTFGDGGVGAGVHASHAFRAGTWTVTLTVTDNASGLSNSVSHAVTISAPVCVVPALRGKLLPAARRALQAAHCSLGHTTTPKRPTRSPGKHKRWQLVVASQSLRAGRVRAKGSTVRVTLVWRAMAI